MNGFDELKKNISDNCFEKLYVIYGEESYLKEYYKNQIIKLFSKDSFSEFNSLIIDGENITYDDTVNFINAYPVMNNRKLLLINDLNLMKLTGEFKDKLPELLGDLPEYITLVFTFTAVDFKPDKRLLLWKQIEKVGAACDISKASRADLIAWIKRRFKALGKTISSENAEYLIFLCGDLMTNLISEIEKIASGTQNNEVQKRHIDELASPTLEAQVFEISDKVLKRDFKDALEILNTLLLLKNEPVAINAILSKQIGRMYIAKLSLAVNKGESYVMKQCGFKSQYPATLLCRSVGSCSLAWIRKAVNLCYKNDLELKSNIPDNERKLFFLLCMLAQEV